MLLRLMALVTAVVHMVSAQERGGSVLRQGENADSQSVIVTPRTRAFLSCESGDIVVKVNFTQAFRGLMYAYRSRRSPCRIHGTGGFYYELRIPLKGCGTWQESPRVFVNNVTIRFHAALELEEDETKTVVCRYPPPLTQPPGSIQVIEPSIISPTPYPTKVKTSRLSEVEILIIICLLLFLSLLTLGIGIAYFCLKRRNIRIIRKSVLSSAPPSQITRLSSSNIQPPSSLLSSVLGHTVRIPRAVPYSAPVGRTSAVSSPDHNYEDYVPSSSATETSGEVSETSVSSSSIAGDHLDSTKNLLYRKGGTKSIFSIPKAILRKAGPKRWRTEAIVHQSHPKSSSTTTSTKRLEMEDQTVTTMLEAENGYGDGSYWTFKEGDSSHSIPQAKSLMSAAASDKAATSNVSSEAPVYAQVDKNRKSPTISQNKLAKRSLDSKWSQPTPVPGAAKRQRQIVTETPEVRKTSEEVTKNTTVTTSVRREVKETKIRSPTLDKLTEEEISIRDAEDELDASPTSKNKTSGKVSPPAPPAGGPNLQKPPKSILIRDVADIYLTTTVETELRELTTKVSRDVVEQHAKSSEASPKTPVKIVLPTAPVVTKVPQETDNWNVVIRQREPLYVPTVATDLDASSESNADSTEAEPKPVQKPQFNVMIRTIPQTKLEPKKPDDMISIAPLEMPKSISKLKEVLTPKTTEKSDTHHRESDSKKDSPSGQDDKQKSNFPQRSVRWMDTTKDPGGSTVSSSDSFQSAESLRERSSSEVLEVAPTLPSQQQKASQQPMLERSTSEIVTSPEDHVRWVGGVVPVLESLSPEFLANIPIVAQGGFFNRQRSPDPNT